ncbi:MAG: cellulose-binding domain-containing protein [Clostridiales bacterium]
MLKSGKIKNWKVFITLICLIVCISVITTYSLFLNAADTSLASGNVPSNFGDELLVGLFENRWDTWMSESGVPWNSRYMYLTKGWADNWGWGENDGAFALEYMQECDDIGAMPVIQYYIMNSMDGGGEGEFYSKTTNADTMNEYFNDFKLLMEAVKSYGKPVIILLEADGFGFLQRQTENNPEAYCAISSSGLTELSDLPDTAAGWGMAFLELKKSVGASNAMLGMHVSCWASKLDIIYSSVDIDLEPEVDKVYNFLSPLGLVENQTGETYDFLVTDPLDRDADYYSITYNDDRWWDESEAASINSKSFNRYAEWLRIWNNKSNKRWILWQIPLGNSNHLNVYNNGNASEGYKDNRAEYFFGKDSIKHLNKFIESGVVALLFGRGAEGQSNYLNDYYSDGELFMKSRVGLFMENGGLKINGDNQSTPITTQKTAVTPKITIAATEEVAQSPIEEINDISALYTIQNDWGNGGTVNIKITNNSTSIINNWLIQWEFPNDQSITSIWNANFAQIGNAVSVNGNSWNQNIESGSSVEFGFSMNYSTSNDAPESCLVNDSTVLFR